MADFPGLKLTDAGRNLQAKAQTGQALTFSRVALGDGDAPESIEALTKLVNEQQTLSIQSQQAPGDGTATLRVIMTNKGVASGFFMRELGVYATDPDTGDELLYSYSNAGDRTDFLPAEGGAVVWEGVFDVITVIGNADNVTALIDDYITIALKSEVDALRPFVLPAGGTAGQMLEKSGNAEGAHRWFDPRTEGMRINFKSVEEPRTAVANQRVFTLQTVVTNGLAVYVNGERLSRESWAQLSATQLRLNDPLNAGDRVLFVQNEEMGTARALDIALDGPTLVYPGSDNEYTLTAFDAFAKISVATTVGTVKRSGAAITLTLPAEVEAETLDLTVTRDNVRGSYRIAIGDAAIAAPEITYPVSGADDVGFEPDLTATSFVAYPGDFDSHATSRWQIATDSAFEAVVFDSGADDKHLTAINVGNAGGRLESARRYYVRVQYAGAQLTSPWSQAVAFNTADVYVRQPRITRPTDGAIDVPESPVIMGDAFSVYGGTDRHVSSDWQVLDEAGVVVWASLENASNLEAIIIPAGVLAEGRAQYSVRMRYRSAEYGASVWSPGVSFVTRESFMPEVAGEPFGGGYFAARMKDSKGEYLLILAPKETDETRVSYQYAASVAFRVEVNGYSDWSLPSLDELRAIYWALKPGTGKNNTINASGAVTSSIPPLPAYESNTPAQTAVEEFKEGQSQALDANTLRGYWSSQTNPGNTTRHYIRISDGAEGVSSQTNNLRAVRRIYL